MKKLIGLAVIVALLSFVACADASVGYRKDGEYQGAVADVNIDGFASSDGRVLTIFSNGHRSGVTAPVTAKVTDIDAGMLAFGVINFADHGTGVISRQISIADGTPGQMVTIMLEADTGTFTLYLTDDGVASGVVTKTGWDDIAFNDALDSVTLLYVDDVVGWIIVGNNGVVVT